MAKYKVIPGGVCAAKGFSASGVHAGFRANPNKLDLAIIKADVRCAAAGVYTTNKVYGAPIKVDRAHLVDGHAQAVLVNSGNADTCAAIGKMQKRTAASVMREIRGDRDALGVAYARKPIQGTVLGIDIETTGRAPERGYIINVGWEIMELTSDAIPHDAEAHYCGLPDIYRGEDVPLSNIHHITWDDIDGKTPFRENKELQKQLLKLMKKYPYMAHNAAFEDSWFKIHLDGYAEARRAGKIIVIDSRQICRSLDADVRSLPRESAPAALENWARRRGTLAADANEQHLGLDDTDLMLRTVQAEFNLKNLFAK